MMKKGVEESKKEVRRSEQLGRDPGVQRRASGGQWIIWSGVSSQHSRKERISGNQESLLGQTL